MNVRVVRLVKYLTVAVTVYFVFHYQDVSLRTAAEGSTRHSKLIKSRRDVVKRQDLKVPETTIPPQYSSMSTTLTSTVSSAFSYSDEELEEEPQGRNMTDLDVSKETEAFLEENKLRLGNVRFAVRAICLSVPLNVVFSAPNVEVLYKVL